VILRARFSASASRRVQLRLQFGHFAKRVSHRGTPQPSCSARMIAVNIAKLPVNIDQTAKSKSNAG
jgi:hypothetical protein